MSSVSNTPTFVMCQHYKEPSKCSDCDFLKYVATIKETISCSIPKKWECPHHSAKWICGKCHEEKQTTPR